MITIFLAKNETLVQRNLLGQINGTGSHTPSQLSLTMWYERYFLKAKTLEEAWSEAQDDPRFFRSAMIGDVIQLGEQYYLIAGQGFEEFTPAN